MRHKLVFWVSMNFFGKTKILNSTSERQRTDKKEKLVYWIGEEIVNVTLLEIANQQNIH